MKNLVYIILMTASVISLAYSCKQANLGAADKKFAEGEYFTAAEMYQKVYRQLPKKKRELRGEVAWRLAESHRLSNNPLRASAAYANAVNYKASDSTLSLQYARTLHKTGDYRKAAEQYNEFLKLYPTNRFALNAIKGTELAQQWKENPTLYRVKRMDLFISARGGEFSPMLLPPKYDQVFFTSNRKEAGGDDKSPITGTKNNDIFMSRLDEKGDWMMPEHIESEINSVYDEGIVSFTADGQTMYYTHSPQDSAQTTFPSIYVSSRSEGKWGKGIKLKIGRDTSAIYSHPAVTPSGDYLYFVSDRKGGYGGKDIWRARLIDQNTAGQAENLGPYINTAGDEMFPYMRSNSLLYFSSDGHAGMGGLDIYRAAYHEKNDGWVVENMKSPINSEGDDFGITFEGEQEKGFFSSNRKDARGWDHIYTFEYPTIKSSIEGYVVDTDDEFVANATIRAVGNDGTIKKMDGRNTGTYSMDAVQGVDYVFLASAPDHLNARRQAYIEEIEKDSVYFVDFILTPINKPVVLENIFFDYDKSTLRDDSKEGLDELIELLTLNPNVSIELSAHTDRKGSEQYNNHLSQRRAESVVSYLVKGGVENGRLLAVGYGKSKPKVVTKAIVKKYGFLHEEEILTEEFIEQLPEDQRDIADQINRRTEFKVLSTTYNIE